MPDADIKATAKAAVLAHLTCEAGPISSRRCKCYRRADISPAKLDLAGGCAQVLPEGRRSLGASHSGDGLCTNSREPSRDISNLRFRRSLSGFL